VHRSLPRREAVGLDAEVLEVRDEEITERRGLRRVAEVRAEHDRGLVEECVFTLANALELSTNSAKSSISSSLIFAAGSGDNGSNRIYGVGHGRVVVWDSK